MLFRSEVLRGRGVHQDRHRPQTSRLHHRQGHHRCCHLLGTAWERRPQSGVHGRCALLTFHSLAFLQAQDHWRSDEIWGSGGVCGDQAGQRMAHDRRRRRGAAPRPAGSARPVAETTTRRATTRRRSSTARSRASRPRSRRARRRSRASRTALHRFWRESRTSTSRLRRPRIPGRKRRPSTRTRSRRTAPRCSCSRWRRTS